MDVAFSTISKERDAGVEKRFKNQRIDPPQIAEIRGKR